MTRGLVEADWLRGEWRREVRVVALVSIVLYGKSLHGALLDKSTSTMFTTPVSLAKGGETTTQKGRKTLPNITNPCLIPFPDDNNNFNNLCTPQLHHIEYS